MGLDAVGGLGMRGGGMVTTVQLLDPSKSCISLAVNGSLNLSYVTPRSATSSSKDSTASSSKLCRSPSLFPSLSLTRPVITALAEPPRLTILGDPCALNAIEMLEPASPPKDSFITLSMPDTWGATPEYPSSRGGYPCLSLLERSMMILRALLAPYRLVDCRGIRPVLTRPSP